MKHTLISLTAIALLATPGPLLAAGKVKSIPNPDFTRGETIPADAKHDWNLGATGAEVDDITPLGAKFGCHGRDGHRGRRLDSLTALRNC